MKPSVSNTEDELVEIPPFDFDHSVPNRFAERYAEGVETTILQSKDKTPVMLEPDVAAYFPDSESVNTALRALIDALASIKTPQEFQPQKAHV